jgi:hypothetical protein
MIFKQKDEMLLSLGFYCAPRHPPLEPALPRELVKVKPICGTRGDCHDYKVNFGKLSILIGLTTANDVSRSFYVSDFTGGLLSSEKDTFVSDSYQHEE